MSKLLVVDDEQAICWGLSKLGRTMGHIVVTASSAEHALEAAKREAFDAIILDVRLPGMSGLDAMRRLRKLAGPIPVIVMTAHGDLSVAVEAVRQEAFEYLPKPFDLDQMRRVLIRALAPAPKTESSARPLDIEGLVGRSPTIQESFKQIALAAASDACVLLQGEAGTGKELAARSIHRFSKRASEPFVIANLSAMSPSQADVELFGLAASAESESGESRPGLLKLADSGTLFVDEISDMPLSTQAKLLRAIEQAEMSSVGSAQRVPLNCRILGAAARNPLDEIESGRLRYDLFFRLNTLTVNLPPLRDRGDDVLELARHFAFILSPQSPASFAAATLDELRKRPWHGNVRELRATIDRATALARDSIILPEHLPPPIPAEIVQPGQDHSPETALSQSAKRWLEQRLREAPQTASLYDEFLQQVEPLVLQTVLQAHHNHLTAAAQTLGLHRHTLRKKLDQYGLDAGAE